MPNGYHPPQFTSSGQNNINYSDPSPDQRYFVPNTSQQQNYAPYQQNQFYQHPQPSQLNQNYPLPQEQYQQYAPLEQIQNNCFIHGLIIGYSMDASRNYLFYSSVIDNGIVQISRTVKDLFIGQWLGITVLAPYFQGEFLLDYSNSHGYENRDGNPDPRYCAAKYFPLRSNLSVGELALMARFGVKRNHLTGAMEMESYDINYKHVVDEYKTFQASSFYEGNSLIFELQISLKGWIVVCVHEDPEKQFSCDTVRRSNMKILPDANINFDIQFLEDCDPELLTIMTGNGYPEPIGSGSGSPVICDVAASGGTLGQDQPSTSTYSTYSDYSEHNSELVEVEQRMSRQAITEVTERPATASSSRTAVNHTTERVKSPQLPRREESETLVDFDDDVDDDVDEDDTEGTLGTDNIPQKEFIKDVSGQTYQRFQAERARNDEKSQTALCTVIHKFDGIAILYTAKRDVLNVLVYEKKCEGVETALQLGQVAFFDIQPRRNETQDELLPRAPYSHIAVRMKPVTPEDQLKIDNFKKSVRCFGGLVEMKVKIELTKQDQVRKYYNDDELVKSENDRQFLFLRATNGVYVSIPFSRLIRLMNSDMTADFDLIAWVSHRKAVGNVSLHIGNNGEAWQRFNNPVKIEELPPV
uniref:DCAF15_WD40 domain-containing protein n=1 Tax=Caenorhabditis tropicalis TaxID=1561998 RepID=A0A1I7UM12_9PELO